MSQFDLTDDQRQIQEMAQQVHRRRDHAASPPSGTRSISSRATRSAQAAELGFGSIYVSEESGGIGLGRLEAALIMEAMAYGCPSTSAFISIHNMASWMIDRFGSADGQGEISPLDDPDGADRLLLPDRARLGLRRRGAQDQARSRTATIMSSRAPRRSSRAAARTRSTSPWSAPARTGPRASPAW